jgi:hypothetical protein
MAVVNTDIPIVISWLFKIDGFGVTVGLSGGPTAVAQYKI